MHEIRTPTQTQPRASRELSNEIAIIHPFLRGLNRRLRIPTIVLISGGVLSEVWPDLLALWFGYVWV